MTDFRNYLLWYQEDQRHHPTRRIYRRNGSGFTVVRNPRLPGVNQPYQRDFPIDRWDLRPYQGQFGIPAQGQPVFGYFQGGGWAFGTTENETHRIAVEVYQEYLDAPANAITVIELYRRESDRADAPIILGPDGQPQIIRVHIGALPPNGGNLPNANDLYLPHISNLAPLDRAGFDHDFALAVNRRNLQSGAISEAVALEREIAIHTRLADFALEYEPVPPRPEDFTGDLLSQYERARQVYWNEIAQRDFLRDFLPVAIEALETQHEVGASLELMWTIARIAVHYAVNPGTLLFSFGQCFGAGTPILMADRSTKPIEQVVVGDFVASFDSSVDRGRGPLVARKVTRLFTSEVSHVLDRAGLIVTPGHRVLNARGEFVALDSLAAHELLVDDKGELEQVGELQEIEARTQVFNFEVEELHTYVAGGLRVHNESGTATDGDRYIYARYDEPGRADMSFVYDAATQVVQITIREPTTGNVISQTLLGDIILETIYQNGTGDFGPEVFGLNGDVFDPANVDLVALMRSEAFSRGFIYDFRLNERVEFGGDIGYQFGSTLGRLLSDDPLGSTVLGVTLGTIGRNLAEAIANGGFIVNWQVTRLDSNVFDDFFTELSGAAVGAVSSLLVGEIFEALGLEGELADLGQSLVNGYVSRIAENLITPNSGLFDGLEGVNVGTIAASFLGARLAAELIEFETIGGQVGASLGSSIGSIAGIKFGADGVLLGIKLLGWAGPVGAFLGAFLGYVFGGIIGSWFGGTPKAGAELGWHSASDSFAVSNSWSKNGGSAAGVRSLASQVGSQLNAIIDATGSHVVDPTGVQTGVYEQKGENFLYKPNSGSGVSFRSSDALELVNHGAFIAATDLSERLVGGDIFVKRAIAATLESSGGDRSLVQGYAAGDFQLEALLGNIAIAADYSAYLTAEATVNGLILNAENSVFAAAWILTMTRAQELGLDRRWKTDWIGGWAGFLDEVRDGEIDGLALSTSNLVLGIDPDRNERLFIVVDDAGEPLGFVSDGIDSRAKALVRGSNANDAITLSWSTWQNDRTLVQTFTIGVDRSFVDPRTNTTFIVPSEITFQGQPVELDEGVLLTGPDTVEVTHQVSVGRSGWRVVETELTFEAPDGEPTDHVRVAALIDGGAGNDTIRGGDLGNDLLGGDGNDVLVGGKLDDWLLGGAGNDRLFAGDAVTTFTVGDATATNAAIAVDGGNGDYLEGGDGDDELYGARGSDWLNGGAGADRLVGGAGGDILAGGADNERGPNGEARILGGAGSDQYIFGFGDGEDVIFDESDPASGVGGGDNFTTRMLNLLAGSVARNWAGDGEYLENGDVRGGEDAIAFGVGVTVRNIVMRRSGTSSEPGNDLIIELHQIGTNGQLLPATDVITIKDWFNITRRVEWLRFADGEEIRIGDMTSFVAGTNGADVIIGTYGADFMVGGGGNDEMRGLAGNDFGFGGGGDDFVAGDGDNDMVSGGSGRDRVIGGAGHDTVFGDDDDDDLYGGSGNDLLAGGRGNDYVVTGAGNDVVRFQLLDGHDTIVDEFVNNWDVVWQNGAYLNGYTLQADGTVKIGSTVVFDGNAWIGRYDWNDETKTLRRHKGEVSGAISSNSGVDVIEFGIGIDFQDIVIRRIGNDLHLAIDAGENTAFEQVGDRLTIRDWYSVGSTIENFVFVEAGSIGGYAMSGGTDGDDTISLTNVANWATGGLGDDMINGNAAIDLLVGGGGNDLLKGANSNDVLIGGSGNDVLEGGVGVDQLIGGEGDDLASYAGAGAAVRVSLTTLSSSTGDAWGDQFSSIEGLEGSNFGDRLVGNTGDNIFRSRSGADTMVGGEGSDTYEFELGYGVDIIQDHKIVFEEVVFANGVFNDADFDATWTRISLTYSGGKWWHHYRLVVTKTVGGEEVYRSRDNIDFIYAMNNQTLLPVPTPGGWPVGNGQFLAGFERTGNGLQTGRDTAAAGNGGDDDTILFGSGISLSDFVVTRPNAGADLYIAYSATDSVKVLAQNNADRAVEWLQLNDGLVVDLRTIRTLGQAGTSGSDFMVADNNANTMDGLAGNDVLSGGGGNDTLVGGEGDDVLEGGAGADSMAGGADSTGSALEEGQTEYGDTIRYVTSTAGVIVNLSNLTAQTVTGRDAAGAVASVGHGHGDTISGVENVTGSNLYGDTLIGSSTHNRLFGLGGSDNIDGGAGMDVLLGGDGDDTIVGGAGEDNISGGAGADTASGGDDSDVVEGGDGADTLNGDGGNDVVMGGQGNDVIHGGDGEDDVSGGEGDDTLYGDAAADDIVGGDGNDTIFGGDGDDEIAGQAGTDTLNGGAGADTYAFDASSGEDTIVDAQGVNRIVITDIPSSALWITQYGNDLRITAIGNPSFSITIDDYSATNFVEIVTADATLYMQYAAPLISAMTSHSASTPASMPASITGILPAYWDAGGNALPRVQDQEVTTVMGATLNGSVGAIDHDNNITGYTLTLSPTGGTVTLETDGDWTYTPNTTFSGEDTFEVEVTDADGNRVRQTVTVFVRDPNQNYAPNVPTITNQAILTVPEGAVGGQLVATLSATDPNGTTPTFRIVNDPGNLFVILGNELRFASGVTLTYAQVQAATVEVEAWDGTLASSTTRTITVGVVETNHTPTLTGQTFSVAESLPGAAQSVVATIAATDGDLSSANRNFRYQVLSGDTSVFAVDAVTGQVRLHGALDYETRQSYALEVRVWDGGALGAGLSSTATFNFSITDVNEAPTINFTGNSMGIYGWVPGSNNVVGQLSGADPEGSALTYIVENVTFRYDLYDVSLEDTQPPSYTYTYLDTIVEDRTSIGSQIVTSSTGVVRWVNPGGNSFTNHNEVYNVTVRSRDTGNVMSSALVVGIYSGREMAAPIVLDLDGDGLEIISIADSTVDFDMAQNGMPQRTGWVAADDGLLVFDRNANGTIDDGGEIAFSEDLDFAVSDLEGLVAFDTNENGQFDAGDADFANFSVWRDLNQDGVSQSGELSTLAPLGIASISLTLTPTGRSVAGAIDNVVYGTTHYVRSDGTVGTVGDVFLAYQTWGTSVEATEGSGGPGQLPPIVFDLDGDGVRLLSPTESNVLFDADNDGHRQRSGWFSAGDGVLAIDLDGNGLINSGAEISFRADGAQTDLEALAAFDSNENGVIDAEDARYGDLLIWQDANQDGVSQTHELASLARQGIATIGLTRTNAVVGTGDVTQNTVLSGGYFTWRDGSVGELADVMLGYEGGSAPLPETDDRTSDDRRRRDSGSPQREPSFGDRFVQDLAQAAAARIDRRQSISGDRAESPVTSVSLAGLMEGYLSDGASEPAIGAGARTGSALHRGLGVSDRRLLHMIDAMASFQPRGAADLARSGRNRDQKVAALLTTLPDGR